MYGLMIAIGILGTFITLTYGGKRLGINEKFLDFTFFLGIGAIVIGFISASLFQAVYNYIENPEAGFNFGQSMTFMGGLIGGVVSFLIIYFIVRNKLSGRIVDVISLVPCCITIAHGFGRIGCFFAGCCYGIETDSFLGVKFPHLDHPVHPTQLYEAAFLFILFGVMLFLLLKFNFRHNMSVYLISYGIFRFLLEFIRGDHRGELVTAVSPSQFWSIPMVALGVALIFILNYLQKKRDIEKAEGKFV
jgi:phosphatidylglycerol:prolipoprotein diacylglycerol transferase